MIRLLNKVLLSVVGILLITVAYSQNKQNPTTDSIITLNSNASLLFNKVGFVEPDNSFQVAIPASDDGVSAVIQLPFSFCFYGSPENELYINNNGNVSIGQPFAANTPLTFPLTAGGAANAGIIAPFWADVDTRGTGQVLYRLTSSALIVVWQEVGYYNQKTDRTNTFQLIITDGFDPLLPQGYNVGFFYDDMAWTTGDASGGLNGFQGVPAAVGINRGNSSDYIDIGRFNRDDASYDGPALLNDGVHWLDKRNMFFSLCDTGNIAPVATGIGLSDTIVVCSGSDITYEVQFIGPEDNQVVNATASSTASGFQVLSNTSGVFSTTEVSVPGGNSGLGNQQINFAAYDNGTPIETSVFSLVLSVDTLQIQPTISGDTAACNGDSVTIQVNPTFDDYLWSTGDTSQAVSVPVGTYQVTVSNGLCEGSTNYTVQTANPSPSIQGPEWVCLPDTFTLTLDQLYDSVIWSTGVNDTLDSVLINTTGTYYVTVSLNGCQGYDSITIKELGVGPYNLTTSRMNSCNGDSVTIDALPGFDSYTWNTGDLSQTIFTGVGFYDVTVTLTSGINTTCSDSDTVTIGAVNFPLPTISGDTFFCFGSSSLLTVNGVYDSYLWSNSDVAQSTTVYNSGTYTVTITQVDCEADTSYTVTEYQELNINISGNRYYCNGDSVDLDAGSFAWDSLVWNTGDTGRYLTVIDGGYSVIGYSRGCEANDTITVNNIANGFNVQGDTNYCFGDSTELNAGSWFDTYLWSTTETTPSIFVDSGAYVVTVTLDTCTQVSDTIRVVQYPAIHPQIQGDTIMCYGDNNSLLVTGSYTGYQWSTGGVGAITVIDTGGVYYVTATDLFGCGLVDSIDVETYPIPTPTISGDTAYCFNSSVTLTTQTYPRYLWSNSEISQAISATSGTYDVRVWDTNNCSAVSPPFVVYQGSPQAVVLGDAIGCQDEAFSLSTPFIGDLTWSTGDTTDTISVNGTGAYSLTVTDEYGCIDSTTFSISSYPNPVAQFVIDPETQSAADMPVDFTDQSSIVGGSIINWTWDFGDNDSSTDQNPTHEYSEDNTYNVQLIVESDSGCFDTATVSYIIRSEVIAFNVITPNGDGINDLLVFSSLLRYPGSTLQIFNRWGELVYTDDNYQNNWDGRFMSDGVYYYVLEVGGTGEIFKGHFTLLK